MWWILLIILGVWFLSVMIWIMFAKITLEINTVDNCYEIRIWGGIKAGYRLSTHEFYVSWGRFEKRVTIHSLKKQKKNPNKNVTPIKENKKPKQFEKLYHFPNLYPLFKCGMPGLPHWGVCSEVFTLFNYGSIMRAEKNWFTSPIHPSGEF